MSGIAAGLPCACGNSVDIINGAAYLFDKVPDRDNQHWKVDLEMEQFRNALEIQENAFGGGKV